MITKWVLSELPSPETAPQADESYDGDSQHGDTDLMQSRLSWKPRAGLPDIQGRPL